MSAKNRHKSLNYSDLQKSIDNLIGKFGLEQTIYIIETFSDNTGGNIEMRKLELIRDYIIGECIQIFNVNKKLFFKSECQKHREARMACYHLLDQYTQSSHSEIAKLLGRKRGSAIYFIQKCKERLSMPDNYRVFITKYKALEGNIICFIAKLK